MKTMDNAASFAVLAAALAMSAGATTYSWNTSSEDPVGVVTNASHFFSGTTPASLSDITPADTVNILTSDEANGEKRLSMPAGSDYSGAWYPVFHAYDNRPVTYDGPGTWRQSDLDPSASLKYGKSAHFALQSWASSFLSVGGSETGGAFLLENAKFRIVRNPADGSPSFDLDRGTMDFYSPNGTEQPGTYLYTASTAYPKTRFAFHAASCFRAPIMHVYARCATNEIVFDGGAGHYIRNFQLRRNDAPADSVANRTRLVVAGVGTKLTLGTFGYTGAQEHTYRVDVLDGATLAISNANESVTQIEGASDVIALSGGGTLLLGDGTHAFSWRNANFVATNGVVDTTATGIESFSLTGVGSARLADSVWRSGNININGSGTTLRFDGGSFSASGLFVANDSGGGSASFVADGGSHTITNIYLSEKSGSDATLRVQNGASLAVLQSFYVGRAVDATATAYVAGGSLDVGDLIVVGGGGSADMEISAGAVTCRRIGFVWSDAARSSVNVLRVTGGEMRVSESVALVAAGGSEGCSATVALDGGVLSVGSMAGSAGCSAVNASKTGTATLAGNGGTLRAAAANADFLHHLNSATCGAKGLAIESDHDVTIAQGFSDAVGVAGELILTGSGVKTLSGTSTVSRIVVADGTVEFAAGAKASSTLVVTNGAKVVFAGEPGNVGLKGLVLGDSSTSGVLALSAGQTLAIDGDVVVNRAKVALDGVFAFGGTNALLTATGAVSGESASAWTDALISSGAVEDYSYDFLVSSDGGVTSLKMSVGDAAFRIVQESGSRDYSAAVELGGASAKALFAVSNAATLIMSGKVARGAVKKVGEGKFYLTNPESILLGGVVSEAGLFSVPTVAALGFGGGLDVFALRGGTLEFTSTSPESLQGSIVVEAGAKTAAVLKNAGDLSVEGLLVESGDLVKRGAGRLVVDSTEAGEVALTRDNGTSSDGWDPAVPAANLDDSGIAPTAGYMGLNVAEGALVLKGGESVVFNAPNSVMVGMQTPEVAAQPELVVDGAKANLATSGIFQFCGYQTASTTALRPRFKVVNGADVSIATFMVGRGQDYSVTTWPTTTVDNATLAVSSFRGGYHSMCNHGIVMRNGARLYATAMLHYGPTYFDVENSVVQKNAEGDCTSVSFNNKAGEWTFRNGSYLALNKMTTTRTSAADAFIVNFDGGTWETGGDHQTFHLCNAEMFIIKALGSGGLTLPVADGKTVNIARAISGDGPIVKTGVGTLVFETQGTWDSSLTTKTPLEDSVSLATTGLLDVREGMVSIQSGACRTGGAYRTAEGASVDFCGNSVGAASFSGAGEFSSATVSGGKIVVPVSDDGTAEAAPIFTSMAFTSGVKVDFCRAKPLDRYAEGLVVATFPDGAPNVSGWRGRNTGEGTRATFRVAANGKDVLADIKTTGFIIKLR